MSQLPQQTIAPLPATRRYYKPTEFAARCGVSVRLIYAKIELGEILAIRLFGENGPMRIPREWADEYLAKLEREKREEIAVDVDEDVIPARHSIRRRKGE